MKYIFIVGLILICLVLPIVVAETDTNQVDDVFKYQETIDYVKPCVNNGTYCGATAVCNFTIFNPDNSFLVNNTQGSLKNADSGAYHNISFTPNNIGVYQVDMVCVDTDGRRGAETLYFEVTGSGLNNTVWFYAIVILFSLGLIVIGFWMEDPNMTLFGSFGLYFLGFYILFNGIVGIRDLVTTWAIGLITLGIAAYISIRSGIEMIGN